MKEILEILWPSIIALIGVIAIALISSNTYQNQKLYEHKEELHTDFLYDLHNYSLELDRLEEEWIKQGWTGQIEDLSTEQRNIVTQKRNAVFEKNAVSIILYGSDDFKQAIVDLNDPTKNSKKTCDTIIQESQKALGREYREPEILELDYTILVNNLRNICQQ